MKKSAHQFSKVKHQLLEKRRNGVKEVIWKLNPSQKEFVEMRLGFETEEYLYEVNTKTFVSIKDKDNLIKNIHYCSKRGKDVLFLKLNPKQKDLLDKYGVKYRPYKYRILLC